MESMKEIGIFIICAQSLIHFTAGREYQKYVKVLIGMMILAQFVAPIRAALSDESAGEMWEEIERFQIEMETVMEETKTMADEIEFSSGDEAFKTVVPADEINQEVLNEQEKEQPIEIEKIEIMRR